MIFTYELYDAWHDGHKRVTRRPMRDRRGREITPPAVGSLLPMQRGYAKATAWARVLSVVPEHGFVVEAITLGEATREGFPSVGAFRKAWHDIYGDAPIDVYRIGLSGPVDVEGGGA